MIYQQTETHCFQQLQATRITVRLRQKYCKFLKDSLIQASGSQKFTPL